MPEEKLKLIKDAPNRYHFKTKDDQRVAIEHKDKQLVLDLFKWGEEASFEIALSMVLSSKHQLLENRVEMETSESKLRAYPIDARSTAEFYGDSDDVVQCDDGGLRLELVLKEKPPINSFTVPIKSKNLRFSYQPFLTEQDIAKRIIRPLNVEGSYAVYHATKKNNQYMTGKAFHIYRPIAEDALGNKAWCSLHIDGYLDPTSLTITVPQQFLDEAVYPVTIDPDFGYSTIGGSSTNIASGEHAQTYRMGSARAMPAPGGTANYIKARVLGDAVCDCKALINQKDSGGANAHGQIAGPVENLNCATEEHWEEFTLGGEALTQGVNYILNILGNHADLSKVQYYKVKYDEDGAVDSYTKWETYGAPESPWSKTPEPTTRDFSIYCNYTAAAAAGLENKSANMGAKMIAGKLI